MINLWNSVRWLYLLLGSHHGSFFSHHHPTMNSSRLGCYTCLNKILWLHLWKQWGSHGANLVRSCKFLVSIRRNQTFPFIGAIGVLVQALVDSRLIYCNTLLAGFPQCPLRTLQQLVCLVSLSTSTSHRRSAHTATYFKKKKKGKTRSAPRHKPVSFKAWLDRRKTCIRLSLAVETAESLAAFEQRLKVLPRY